MKDASVPTMMANAKPLCPRDNSVMHFEPSGRPTKMLGGAPDLDPDYECLNQGCTIRFNTRQGYFTVVDALEHSHPVEEPGTNLLQCPRHELWLYRCENDPGTGERYLWRCAVQGCDYVRAGVGGIWLRE